MNKEARSDLLRKTQTGRIEEKTGGAFEGVGSETLIFLVGELYVWRAEEDSWTVSLVSLALEVDFKASEAEQGFRGEGYPQV